MSNGKKRWDWSMPKFNKWFWVMLAGLVVFLIIMAIQWMG